MRSPQSIIRFSLFTACCALSACATSKVGGLQGCPKEVPAGPIIPGQAARHEVADFWLAQYRDAERTIMSAREIADHIYFTDRGVIVEHGPPSTFFKSAKDPRTREFLSQIL